MMELMDQIDIFLHCIEHRLVCHDDKSVGCWRIIPVFEKGMYIILLTYDGVSTFNFP